MTIRTLLALPLLLTACAPVPLDGDDEPEDGVSVADLPGEVRIEAEWDDVYGFVTVWLEYGGVQGTRGVDRASCATIAGFEAEVEGARLQNAGMPDPGGFEAGRCHPPQMVLQTVQPEGPVALTLRDSAGASIRAVWDDVGVRRQLEFETVGPTLEPGEVAWIVGRLPGDSWKQGDEVTLSWFTDVPVGFGQDWTHLDARVIDGDVRFTVPASVPPDTRIGGLVNGGMVNEAAVCEGVESCTMELGPVSAAEAFSGSY
jgi:hypothetical protein